MWCQTRARISLVLCLPVSYFFDFGSVDNRIDATEFRGEAADAELRAIKGQIFLDAISAFYEVRDPYSNSVSRGKTSTHDGPSLSSFETEPNSAPVARPTWSAPSHGSRRRWI